MVPVMLLTAYLPGFAIDSPAALNAAKWMRASNPSRAQGKSDTSAVELKWMHWFSGPGPLGINKITLTGLLGERVYAVDPDSAVVYNIADVQKGSVAAASTWRINDRNEILLQFGYEQYTNELIADDYSYPYLYIDFTHNWN
jgi:hypothetical protein